MVDYSGADTLQVLDGATLTTSNHAQLSSNTGANSAWNVNGDFNSYQAINLSVLAGGALSITGGIKVESFATASIIMDGTNSLLKVEATGSHDGVGPCR